MNPGASPRLSIFYLTHRASSGNQISPRYKLIGNLSAGTLAALAMFYAAPLVDPSAYIVSVLIGLNLALLPTVLKAPRKLVVSITALFGMSLGYFLSGAIGAIMVALGVACQIDAINSGLKQLKRAPESQLNQIRAQGEYCTHFTLLKTVVAATAVAYVVRLFVP